MPRVYLGLGSNIDAERNLALGLSELESRYGTLERSPVYRNAAIGFEGEDFLNMVVGLDSEAGVDEIVSELEIIHDLAGRNRGEQRYASRTLDIDLLLYGDLQTDGLPREDILKYGFVLKPLADIAPGRLHPETGRSFAEHWADLGPALPALLPVDLPDLTE